MARWNLSISEKTDRAVRTYLARTGGKKGNLSRFVEEAVRRRVLDLTVLRVKDRNARYDQREILDLIDGEVNAARAEAYRGGRMSSGKSESRHVRQEYSVPDGLSEITNDLPPVIEMIARTARWVHPEIFRALPVWCPDAARGLPRYDARWSRILCNKRGQEKREENIRAANALVEALGVKRRPKPKNWTTCHIWGYDDPDFAGPSKVVQNRRYYSCVGNMVWLPTPLKGFTDAVPEIKLILRHCAFHLYGWVCEHPYVADQAREVRRGSVPSHYPTAWPTAERRIEPPGIAPASDQAWRSVEKAKAKIRKSLADTSLEHYPRAEVQKVLDFWKITL